MISNKTYIPGVDGLRAIAVLSVVLYHWDHAYLSGGFVGVDIFFVISGYVISKSLAAADTSSFIAFIFGFYQRRVLRIVPALLVCLTVTGVFSILFIPDSWLSASNMWTAIWAYFGASNLYLVAGADGYFSDRIGFNPFAHTWSLAVEEQFYLIFPVIFFIWLRLSRSVSRHRVIALWILPGLAVASLVVAAYQTGPYQVHAFYLLPSRFWELAVGALLFQFQTTRITQTGGLASYSFISMSGALLIGIALAFTNDKAFPFPWALLPVVGTVMLIHVSTCAKESEGALQRLLASGIMTYVGRISYSLYLWHWAVFTLFRWTVGMDAPILAAVALLLTFCLASLSYHWVERPIRSQTYLNRQPSWKIVILGLFTVSGTALMNGLALQYGDSLKLKQSVTTDRYNWNPDFPIGVQIAEGPAQVPPTTKIGAGKSIFVVGDSHAGAYANMVKLTAATLGASVRMRSRNGCPIVSLIEPSIETAACRDSELDFFRRLRAEAHAGDIVFLASLRLHRFGDQWGLFDQSKIFERNSSHAERERRVLALAQAASLIAQFQALGLHVLIDAPKPIFRAPPFRCSDWFNKSNPICEPGFTMDRGLLLRYREPTMASVMKLKESLHIDIWDPFPILCNTTVCSAFDGDKPLFFDGDHLSGHGARKLVPSFTNKLTEIWLRDARQ